MSIIQCSSADRLLTLSELQTVVENISALLPRVRRVLLIHPDYSRHDFSHLVSPMLYHALEMRGLERLDTLNAGGTHRAMSSEELRQKLGFGAEQFPKLGTMYNHEFDNPEQLVHVVDIEAGFVAQKTSGHLNAPMPVNINRLLFDAYDAVIALSGTVPHEAIGFSGGTKIFFPGISGQEVIALLHWAAVLMGIPQIIGTLNNPAREVVNEGAKHIFKRMGSTPVVSLDMVYTEDSAHRVEPRGLFAGTGFDGFQEALTGAAELSGLLHFVYLDQPMNTVVQHIPEMYDEIWTAGKGSYKLQKPGVIAEGGEIILFAPHIDCFHSNKQMDAEMRQIGYHGRDYVVEYCGGHPRFNKNVASHVINVRGLGKLVDGVETFPFQVTLATKLSEADCLAAGLGYRDPKTLRRQEFQAPGKLWIEEGGQWLYARR